MTQQATDFSMARLDRIKTSTGLAECFGKRGFAKIATIGCRVSCVSRNQVTMKERDEIFKTLP